MYVYASPKNGLGDIGIIFLHGCSIQEVDSKIPGSDEEML